MTVHLLKASNNLKLNTNYLTSGLKVDQNKLHLLIDSSLALSISKVRRFISDHSLLNCFNINLQSKQLLNVKTKLL